MCDNARECTEAARHGFGTPPDASGQTAGRREIRRLREDESGVLLDIINEAAEAYRGVIPGDRWHDPYMSEEYLAGELQAGVRFWGYEVDGELLGVMGIQDVADVTLIRHAYVRTAAQRGGIGGRLLRRLLAEVDRPVLIGTWLDAHWAIAFYERNGFEATGREETERLLRTYWEIPARQVETSVVLKQVAG
ncbi:MAG: GNAT family N-acetyltransferase [Actinobacteria bacterium HGW-Actinobacteria-6]|jgi:GNAT superfamily N-acetyltransferase|nr:MAG: GNAT family N-acetyltransferase [Actinobacteria bacterium HGW-Actinobacteria-6]